MTAHAVWTALDDAGLRVSPDPEDAGVIYVQGPQAAFTSELRDAARQHRFPLARAARLRDQLVSDGLDAGTVAKLVRLELTEGSGSLLRGAAIRNLHGHRLGGEAGPVLGQRSGLRLGFRW